MHKYGIGIDIGGTKIEAALIDKNGKIIQRKKIASRVSEGYLRILKDIVELVKALQASTKISFCPVGVGMAGQIKADTGGVAFAPNLGWHNVPLQSDLSDALQLPVIVTNDVRAAAWGEWLYGAGQGFQDLLCLFIGTGIGSGIIVNGQMICGANNAAGELGHTTLILNGPKCTCGNFGCLETAAAGWAIAKIAKSEIKEKTQTASTILREAEGQLENITAQHVVKAAINGDSMAQKIIQGASDALAAGCISFVNAFNPSRLIIGGGLGLAIPGLLEHIEKEVKSKALQAATQHLTIVPASLKNDAGLVGAASYALDKLLQED